MNLKVVSDGEVFGTRVVSAETGEPVADVTEVVFRHGVGDYPRVELKLRGVEADAAGEAAYPTAAGPASTSFADSPPLMLLSPKRLSPEGAANLRASIEGAMRNKRRLVVLEEGLITLQLVNGRWCRVDADPPRPSLRSRLAAKAKAVFSRLRSFERRLTGY